ncbi:MAG: DMT family transporter [Deferribacteraceae bacterium]|jgi:drug/metabolite transporter (DMT)-like permease|nr:DMT family transporter [Deferribacteraceae bacterium]
MLGFLLVIVSALFHALWNILLKKSYAKFRFNCYMHVTSVFIFSAIVVIFYPDYISFERDLILYGLYAAVFFSAYHLLVTKAYQLADVSQVYPITTASPVFVIIWAALLLSEKLKFIGILGVTVTAAGCFVMNSASIRHTKLQPGVVIAIFAAFAYSFGALFDKVGVNTGNAVMYTYYMNLFMALFFGITYFLRYRGEPKGKGEAKWMWIAGLIITLSALTYRFGIAYMPISYGVTIRQISGLFGVIMGILFFREGYGKMRIAGAVTILAGISLIRFAML